MKAFQASILFSAAVLALTACHSNTYKISGAVEGLNDGDTLFITNDLQTGIPTDTLIVKDGKFELSGETDSTYLCMVYSEKRNELNAPFFIEPGNISIKLVETPGASRVGGTKCNEQWQELNDSVMTIGKEINQIAEHIYGGNVSEEEQKKGMEKIDRLNQRFSAMLVKCVEKNIDNEFGYFLLTYYPEELIDNNQRTRLINLLPEQMRKRSAIQQMQQLLTNASKTAEGASITDFTQKSLDGNDVSLMEEIKKNKVTVIDFWASWCGPCRQEMPFMLQLYEQLHAKGLGFIGISLDNEEAAWKQATEALGVKWPQMSDLKGWENEIAQYFNVTSIPHTIVVDQQGKILRRGLRGEQLQKYIESQLQ
jgi:thiol-disulfide isomerase/thioredoxin